MGQARRWAWVLVVTLCVGVVRGQEAVQGPADDGPAEAVRTYIEACARGDLEAAQNALVPGQDLPEAITEALTGEAPDEGRDVFAAAADILKALRGALAERLAEVSLLPSGVDPGAQVGEVVVQGDTARALVLLERPSQMEFFLQRGADGAWRLDLVKTLQESETIRKPFVLQLPQVVAPARAQQELYAARVARERRLHMLGSLLLNYARYHGDRLPEADVWEDEITADCRDPVDLERLGGIEVPFGYALNAPLAGSKLPAGIENRRRLVLLFETEMPSKSAVGDLAADALSTADEPTLLCFADGQIGAVPAGWGIDEALLAEAQAAQCGANIRAICRALVAYARDHDRRLPRGSSWCDDIEPYLSRAGHGPETLKCPSRPELECGYALNAALAGRDVTGPRHHDKCVLVMEARRGVRNEVLTVPVQATSGRHVIAISIHSSPEETTFDNVGMLDGSISWAIPGRPFPGSP